MPSLAVDTRDSHAAKLLAVMACPECHGAGLDVEATEITCRDCAQTYPICDGVPVLIPAASRVWEWFSPASAATRDGAQGALVRLYQRIQRQDRVWTRRSQAAIARVLEEKDPDAPERAVVLIGAGIEPVFRRLLAGYEDCLRVGLALQGHLDAYGDACSLPVRAGALDAILSSSVLEHVYDPEMAVASMARGLKPGGLLYAEIPFLRAYHMEPIDYQRYTVSGIRELFERHGLLTEEVGICSGPFTALILYLRDLAASLLYRTRYLRAVAELTIGVLLHPVKYLDRLFETSEGARLVACNFYYLGRKPETREGIAPAGVGGTRGEAAVEPPEA